MQTLSKRGCDCKATSLQGGETRTAGCYQGLFGHIQVVQVLKLQTIGRLRLPQVATAALVSSIAQKMGTIVAQLVLASRGNLSSFGAQGAGLAPKASWAMNSSSDVRARDALEQMYRIWKSKQLYQALAPFLLN